LQQEDEHPVVRQSLEVGRPGLLIVQEEWAQNWQNLAKEIKEKFLTTESSFSLLQVTKKPRKDE
jgi:hypothetical protein